MPGVRYGPDLSDDAAFVVDRVMELQEKLRRGAKLRARDELRDYERAASFAEDVFGVSREDFDAGRFGDMAEIAKYGASNSRAAYATSWRTKKVLRKTVAQEMFDRDSKAPRRSGSSTKMPKEPTYMGRTMPPKFRALERAAQQRVAKGGIRYGTRTIPAGVVDKANFLAKLDRLGVARVAKGASFITSRPVGPGSKKRYGDSIRPELTKSIQRREQRARKKGGGGGRG